MGEYPDRLVSELIDAVKKALKKEQSERLRDVYLIGDIEKDVARTAIERLRELANEGSGPINLYVNTAGGNVTDGLALHDAILQLVSEGIEVSIIVQGMAYSMGSVVLQAASPGRRFSFPHSWIMIHEPAKWAGWQSTTAAAQHLDRLKQMQSQIYRILSSRSGRPLRQIIRDTKRTDFYLDATKALEYGLIDRVLGVTHASTPVLSDINPEPRSETAAASERRNEPPGPPDGGSRPHDETPETPMVTGGPQGASGAP
jgi:ATP-dependent Clp protease protease subunit